MITVSSSSSSGSVVDDEQRPEISSDDERQCSVQSLTDKQSLLTHGNQSARAEYRSCCQIVRRRSKESSSVTGEAPVMIMIKHGMKQLGVLYLFQNTV